MSIALEIVSPEKLLLSRPVDMVVIPASESDMGVLAGHTPTIVMLRGGLISLYEGDRVTDTLFVAGCFADVTPERCTVLANEVSPVAELNKAVGEQRLAEAEKACAVTRSGAVASPWPRTLISSPGRTAPLATRFSGVTSPPSGYSAASRSRLTTW